MTATLERPAVGDTLTSREQMAALPVGTVVEQATHLYRCTEPDVWYRVNGGGTRFNAVNFGGEVPNEVVVISYPEVEAPADVEERIQVAVAEALADRQRDHDTRVRNLNATITRYATRIEVLNERLITFANENDLTDEMDSILEDFSDIEMKTSEVEYEVEQTITVKHTRTVRARSEDEAIEKCNEATGFYDGLTTDLYSESVEITGIESEVDEV